MSASNALSLLCLIVTGCIATAGIFSRHFDDSLLQRIGLAVIAMACILRVPEKIGDAAPDTPGVILFAQVGLAVYAVGTLVKVRGTMREQVRRSGGLWGRRLTDAGGHR